MALLRMSDERHQIIQKLALNPVGLGVPNRVAALGIDSEEVDIEVREVGRTAATEGEL